MPKPSSLTLAKDKIFSILSSASQKNFSQKEIAHLFTQNRDSWQLAKRLTLRDFIVFLSKHGDLHVHKFRSNKYGHEITRYSWGKLSPFELALCIKPRAYLCHGTAATLNGVAKLSMKTLYVNVEQSVKPPGDGTLTQEAIKRAFSGNQRQSNLVYDCNGLSVILISGKNTNRLGVEERAGPRSELLQVTNLERTLIDIVVRPAYAGGISQVYKAYRRARDAISVDKLLAILEQLDYVYPYHQCIGFLMQETGYPERSYARLRALGLHYDFYLAHALQKPKYSNDWRLFYPNDLLRND
jgi:hypothetical protein